MNSKCSISLGQTSEPAFLCYKSGFLITREIPIIYTIKTHTHTIDLLEITLGKAQDLQDLLIQQLQKILSIPSIDPSHATLIESKPFGTTKRGGPPDLLVRSLFVDDIRPFTTQIDLEHTHRIGNIKVVLLNH